MSHFVFESWTMLLCTIRIHENHYHLFKLLVAFRA